MSKINNLKKYLSNTANDVEIGDLILNFFNKEFSEEDYLHVLRQERWKYGIHCPFCQSANIKKQPALSHVFKYLCLDCGSTFEDHTGTPISNSTIPLQLWIQCWYLSQYCNSLQYIADKLNLDINIITNIIHSLQNLFQTDTLAIRNKNTQNNFNESILNKRAHIEESFKTFLRLGGDTGKQPTDTAEYRKQKNRKKPNM